MVKWKRHTVLTKAILAVNKHAPKNGAMVCLVREERYNAHGASYSQSSFFEWLSQKSGERRHKSVSLNSLSFFLSYIFSLQHYISGYPVFIRLSLVTMAMFAIKVNALQNQNHFKGLSIKCHYSLIINFFFENSHQCICRQFCCMRSILRQLFITQVTEKGWRKDSRTNVQSWKHLIWTYN